ncbi:sigma-54 dependent transcriptional regulator [bacterium]|nr:sigma-54 dependent transcriptional regulator [bacterium]
MKTRNHSHPLILSDIFNTPDLPENLFKLAEIEKINSILIAPVVRNEYVKGTLVLGSDDAKALSVVNAELMTLLTGLVLYLNERGLASHSAAMFDGADFFGGLIGKSKPMQDVYRIISKIADSDSNALISGESGTGKELVARAIHEHSNRKDHAFIAIDCGALPGTLLESELFGFERGAFTGASNVKKGLVECAEKGTLFLDEITEMSVDLQAKLLRVLQERQFRRVGGRELIDVNLRVIAAMSREPRQAIANKILRQDLFYRLNVIPIHTAPLRARVEDIELLARHFLNETAEEQKRPSAQLTSEAIKRLENYSWPGNVRELRNFMERIFFTSKGDIITIEDLPLEIRSMSQSSQMTEGHNHRTIPYTQAKADNLISFERSYFSKLIDKYSGNISRVSKEARVSRKTIYNILKKHNIHNADSAVLTHGGS